MTDVFLSYSREDQAIARRFADSISAEGFSVWWDQALDAGESFDEVTEQALKGAKAVVVLWSRHSVVSRWVRAEATQADRYHTLVPVTIEPCDRPIMFELKHTADLSGWNGAATDARWRAFIDGLRRTVGKTGGLGALPAVSVTAPPTPTSGTVRASRTPSRTTLTWTAIAALIAIGAGLYWQFQLRESKSSIPAESSPTTEVPPTLASVAVLPFRDMSQNKDQEYFADGVTEEILNTLAGLKDLKVTARTSAFAFKGKDVDLRTVGETLGVQHILEGSIRKDGEKLRVVAQLIDAKSNAHIWSRTYDRPLREVFAVQEDIARSVAEALQVALGVGLGKQSGMTRDIDAYDAYLAGTAASIQFNTQSQRRAIESFEQAVARDPAFGLAYVRLYGTYMMMTNLEPQDPQGWMRKADAALDSLRRSAAPDDPSVHVMLCLRGLAQSRWEEAESHLQAASRKASIVGGTLDRRDELGLLLAVGKTRQAIALLEQDRARDPLNPEVAFRLALAYGGLGDMSAATAESERAYKLGSQAQGVFRAAALTNALGTGDTVQVRRALDAYVAIPNKDRDSDINVQMRTLLDRPAEAAKLARKWAREPAAPPFAISAIALWLSYFGDKESALEALRAVYQHGGGGPALASNNLWQRVHSEARLLPAFKLLVHDMGLVDYWRTSGWGDFCKPVGETDFECD